MGDKVKYWLELSDYDLTQRLLAVKQEVFICWIHVSPTIEKIFGY